VRAEIARGERPAKSTKATEEAGFARTFTGYLHLLAVEKRHQHFACEIVTSKGKKMIKGSFGRFCNHVDCR
jgi:hypothetical protein